MGALARSSAPETLQQSASEAWPYYGADEIDAVTEVLRSGKVNQWTGSKVREFEAAYEGHVGLGHAIALANGSLALELALRAFGIGPGDDVIVTPRSFVASASCVRLVGARPIFAEVHPDSGNITAETIAAVLTPSTKAIIPVHLAGWPAEMPSIMELARQHGIKVIEDCAQAHGAQIGGRPVGSFGDAAAFSFCQDKIITTAGEGGLVLFWDRRAYEWAWSFKDHGKNLEKVRSPDPQPGFRWLHDAVGTNWRMLEISAAVGLIQLQKLDQWRRARTRNAMIWAEALRDLPVIRMPQPPEGLVGAYYKTYAYLTDEVVDRPAARAAIIAAAAEHGIKVFSGSCSEVYLEKAFADLEVERLPVARELGEASLMFEVHPTLDPELLGRRASRVSDIIAELLC